MGVVVGSVDPKDLLQVASSDDPEPVQALVPDGADPTGRGGRSATLLHLAKDIAEESPSKGLRPHEGLQHQTGSLVLDPAKAVVDGVLDGRRGANRRTTDEQTDGKHQIPRT
jgi:hypothetical protein